MIHADLEGKPMSDTNIAELKTRAAVAPARNVTAGFDSLEGFELMQRAAKLLASSSLVPREYQGNIANTTIALNMAQRLDADPLQVMQNLYVVHGKPGWSSQFLIATFNTCGRFSAMRFEFFGKPDTDGYGCRAWSLEKATGEKLVGTDVTIDIAKKEGWYKRSGSKWQTMPQQMLTYRAAAWFVRAYAPEVSMGLPTTDEIGDTYTVTPDTSGAYTVMDLGDVTEAPESGVQPSINDIQDKESSIADIIAAINDADSRGDLQTLTDDLPVGLLEEPDVEAAFNAMWKEFEKT